MSDLEGRLQALEDLEAIKRLKADYCVFADIWATEDPQRGSKFAALFDKEGRWNVGHKLCVGPSEIESELMSLPESWSLSVGIHLAVNPRIDIDGDTAKGTWMFLIPTISKGQTQPVWTCGMYFETYIRTPQGWRFSEVRLESAFSTGN